MAILYFAFANDQDHPLDQLKNEYERIKQLLEPLEAQGKFVLKMDPFASLDNIADNLSNYKKELTLFHYAGHANQKGMLLDGKLARARGIAPLLQQCPQLKLVFLNGCSTLGQLQELFSALVPSVILTSVPIGDDSALTFAEQFYKQLSIENTLENAFISAQAKVEASSDVLSFNRSIGLPQIYEESTWGIYYLDGREDMQDWKLQKTSAAAIAPANYEPNAAILKALLTALGPYKKKIKQINQQIKLGQTVSNKQKRKEILLALPHPISEQLRKLLSPETSNIKAVFYDKASLARMVQMVFVYRMVMKTLCFTLMAHLWDIRAKDENVQLNKDEQEFLKNFFRSNYEQSQTFSYLQLLKDLLALFKSKGFDFFIEKFKQYHQLTSPKSNFHLACEYLELRHQEIFHEKIGEDIGIGLCDMVEQKLAEVLETIGFFGKYTFTSIKNTQLIKYRHYDEPIYNHSIVRLVQEFVGLDEENVIWSNYIDTTSVLLVEKDEEEDIPLTYLNLSPFMIDLNAFDSKASLAKLYFLERFIKEQEAFEYSHIYMQGDNSFVLNQKLAFHHIVLAQFDHYSELLFQNDKLKDVL